MRLLESGSCPGSATFHPGSICNLACVTCGPDASTRWQRELGMPVESGNPKTITPDVIKQARLMTGVIICGGEPVLNFSSLAMLQNLQTDQTVRIHFNGTVLPGKDVLEQSARFGKIHYAFSIDGVDKRFEYLRWPANWNKVTANIQWLYDNAPANVDFAVVITVSQLNRYYQQEILDWIDQYLPSNRQGRPTVINYNKTGNILHAKYLDNLDQKRNLNWRSIFPLAVNDIVHAT